MRKIQVNGIDVKVKADDTLTFGELKVMLKDEIEGKELVVTKIVCDGNEVYQRDPDSCLKSQIGVHEEILITAETIGQITERLLENGAAFLMQLKDNVLRISEAFRTKSKEEAFDDFIGYIDCLQQVYQLLEVMQKSNSIQLLSTELDGKTGEELIRNFAEVNKEILNAQENKDVVLIADLLEYELSPSIGALESLLLVRKDEMFP